MEEHCRGQGNKYQLQWTCCPQPEGEGQNGQCSERGRGERSADSYTVEYRPMQRGNDWVAYEGISLCHCHLKDLLYDTEYSVRVKALNIRHSHSVLHHHHHHQDYLHFKLFNKKDCAYRKRDSVREGKILCPYCKGGVSVKRVWVLVRCKLQSLLLCSFLFSFVYGRCASRPKRATIFECSPC